MPLFSSLRTIFSLDILDSRFTTGTARSTPKHSSSLGAPSSHPAESSRSKQLRAESSPPKWNTPEYYLYYTVLAVAIPWMFKVTYDLSKESHPNYHIYEHLLSPGWIPGRKVDNSDNQYGNFRDNFLILVTVPIAHFFLRRGFNELYGRFRPTALPFQRLNCRVMFDVVFALIFLTVLHSLSVLKILVIITLNFAISYFHPGSILNPILTWAFNIGVLFANEYFGGYHFRHIIPWLLAGEGSGVGYAMDHVMNGGVLQRWEIGFNITVLRLISYNLDHYWAARRLSDGSDENGSVLEKKQLDPASMSERDRIDSPANIKDYCFLNYVAYVLYSPLYLAGPIITYNDFIHQLMYPSPTLTTSRVLKYGIRFIVSVLCMEIILHYLYVVAISKTASSSSWTGATPFQLAMIGYFNLHIIWLKLLIPWRFFRLWSLTDNLDPPENMLRCMSNNYSALAFWRSWHRSFNRWIVRYIYIPLGGSRRPILCLLVVFTFVALWHDLSLKLLTWGWMVVGFILPEIIVRKIFSPKKFESRKETYRLLAGLGGVLNVLMMMAANLVGFAIGLDGLRDLIKGVLGSFEGAVFLACAGVALFTGVQVMFEIREEEKRGGVDLKC